MELVILIERLFNQGDPTEIKNLFLEGDLAKIDSNTVTKITLLIARNKRKKNTHIEIK